MNCRKCGRFLEKYENDLCKRCYEEFIKWSSRRFTRLATKKLGEDENPLTLWLKEVKKHGKD